jgi:hypothetical protein
LKQRRLGPAAFWESLRIVFLREDLLGLVNDQIEALQPRSSDTFRARKVRAKAGKRAVVSFLIRQDHPERWSLHEYEYFLPFVGVLFGMADGANLVQIAMPRPRQSVSDALYFEFVDSADQYFGNGFRDVIADSREDNEVVLVGTPDDDSDFYVNGARFRRSALREDQNAQEWLPSVTVVTWTIRNGRKTPVLQVRTEENSTQYLHHLSHISGYINESDLVLADSEAHWSDGSSIVLPIGAARNAATRELIDQLNFSAREEELQLFGVCRFNNYDRENLFFYVFSLQLPAIHQYPESSQIRAWGLPELISLHEYQVLSKAAELLRVEDLSSAQRTDGARILACQLTLHGQLQLGQRIVRAAQRSTSALPDGLSKLAAQHVVQVRLEGRQTTLSGLAEIHYREFFSTLLPLYAQVGVSGAARAVDGLQRIDGGRDALAQLMEAYGDDELLSSLPFDL